MSEHTEETLPEIADGIKVDGEENGEKDDDESKFGMVVVAGEIENFDPESQDARPFE
jgi:hypothetical protein